MLFYFPPRFSLKYLCINTNALYPENPRNMNLTMNHWIIENFLKKEVKSKSHSGFFFVIFHFGLSRFVMDKKHPPKNYPQGSQKNVSQTRRWYLTWRKVSGRDQSKDEQSQQFVTPGDLGICFKKKRLGENSAETSVNKEKKAGDLSDFTGFLSKAFWQQNACCWSVLMFLECRKSRILVDEFVLVLESRTLVYVHVLYVTSLCK